MRIPRPLVALCALPVLLLLPQPLMAQLEDPEASCFEPVKPACAEVTVGSEDEGWALRCREELATFLEDLDGYEQCIVGRLDTIRERATTEHERVNCMVEQEQNDGEGGADCD